MLQAPSTKTLKDLNEGPFLFIVNPNSGTGAVERFQSIIKSTHSLREIEVAISNSPAHSVALAQKGRDEAYAAVIAVGGDGSVHEIGEQLIGSNTPLGIIPAGSGNGISRHLGINNNINQAVIEMLNGKQRAIDTFEVNGQKVIGFCGTGIDAFVAKTFDEATERGFSNYVKLTIDAFNHYTPQFYTLVLDGKETILHQAFTIVVANISQFGNNAYINPTGTDDDGLLEVIVIKDFPPTALMPLASRLFLKNIHKSKWVKVYQAKNLSIETNHPMHYQIDGEPMTPLSLLNFGIKPKSLNVIVPAVHGK